MTANLAPADQYNKTTSLRRLPGLFIVTKEMKQANRSVRDLEKDAIDEAHLANTTIRSLTWRCIDVEKRSWMSDVRPAPILSKIDGYAEAGTLTQQPETRFLLNWIRDTHRLNGTFWQRQDHATERTCSSESRYQTKCHGQRGCQRLYYLGYGFAKHKLLR